MYLSFSLIKIHPCYWFKFAKKILKEKQTYQRCILGHAKPLFRKKWVQAGIKTIEPATANFKVTA